MKKNKSMRKTKCFLLDQWSLIIHNDKTSFPVSNQLIISLFL
jgi:hypothetical protein